jgi:hypothetical protein
MNQKLSLTLALTLGLLGGGLLSRVMLPTVFAQSQPTRIYVQPTALTTGKGIKVGNLDLTQGTIKLSPVVKIRIAHTDGAVTLELTPGENSN